MYVLPKKGLDVLATNKEINTETETVSPNCVKYLPIIPLIKAIGTKTATIENVVDTTARPIHE